MKRILIPIFILILLIALSLSALVPIQHMQESTADPFAAGSFYATESFPTPTPDFSDQPKGFDKAVIVYIPAGEFTMGAAEENKEALSSEKPAHQVDLSAYWIDKYEVTNRQFAACTAAGYCYAPRDLTSATHEDYYTNEAYADYPVIHVDWNQAYAYCYWARKRLPTEAEWEKAARGTDQRVYAWGNEMPETIPMNVSHFQEGDTTPVGSFPEGASAYGVMDMGGNVWEWTADQYQKEYYNKSPEENPAGPTGGNQYVIRGLSWAYPFSYRQITLRNNAYILNHAYDVGFRCALSE